MTDLEQLNEALSVPARPLGDQVPSMRGWYALPLDVIDQRTIAARAYATLLANGEELEPWMVEDHEFGWALPVDEDGRYLVIRLPEANQ